MRIVHLLSSDFRPPDNGARIKSSSLATALASVGELHIVELGRHRDARPAAREPDAALPAGLRATFHSVVGRELARAGWAGALARGWRLHRRRIAQMIVRGLAPDVVVADDIELACLAETSGAALRIAHLHNLESELHREIARQSGKRRFLRKMRRYQRIEERLLPRLQQVWGVRQSDLDHLWRGGCRSLVLTPNVVPDGAFDPQPAVGEPGRGLYFGFLGWGPNADGARELAALAGRLRAMGEAVTLVVAGRGASAELSAQLQATAGLEVRGFVPSLRDEATRAAAILIPLTWGGGTKIKTIEALALGKPVLTTPQGAAGLDLIDGEHALVRPPGPAFDQAAIEVLRAPERFAGMGLRGQAYVRGRYTQAVLTAVVQAALRSGPRGGGGN